VTSFSSNTAAKFATVMTGLQAEVSPTGDAVLKMIYISYIYIYMIYIRYMI